MFEAFFGDLHPLDFKRATLKKPSLNIVPPPIVVIPMTLRSGEKCTPIVSVGDIVKMGQKIGDSKAPLSAPVHASVSGKVIKIEPKLISDGNMVTCVVIENDGLDALSDNMAPRGSENITDPEVLCSIVREAGIVGMGGSEFPTAAKLTAAVGKADTLIINGVESEPYITSDHRVMSEHPDELMQGIRILKRALGVPFACLGVGKNMRDALSALSFRCGSDIKIYPLKASFPQDGEKKIIKLIVKREVPPGGSPLSVRSVLFNVSTVYAIYRAVYEGMPLIERVVTVAGDAVKNPMNIICRIGTPIGDVFEAAGGFVSEPYKVLVGGPMTGTAQYDLSVPVSKGTRSLLALKNKAEKDAESSVCIRCGRCAEVCPMRLMPLYIHMAEKRNDLESLEKFHVADCVECGICTYVCPGRLYLMQSCKLGKVKIGAAKTGAKEEAVKHEQRA